jgi:DNA-binding IclR family transcriptional regulator
MNPALRDRKRPRRSNQALLRTATSRSQGIKSVEIVGRILRALTTHARAASLKEIARSSGMPAPKIHRYLVSLIRIGMVQQSLDDKSYGLGAFALEVGAIAARSNDPLLGATKKLQRLRDMIDETITLSVWSHRGPIILEVEESTRPIVMTMRRGTVLPVLSTASGVVFCAQLPRFQTSALIEVELAGGEENNPIVSNEKELERLLVTVRAQGYAINSGHLLPDIIALAAPVFDRSGSLVAVLGVIGRENRIDPRWDRTVLDALLSVTRNSGCI